MRFSMSSRLFQFAAAALSTVFALAGEADAQGWGWDAPRPRAPWWAERRWDNDPYEYRERRRYRLERQRAWRERDPEFGEDGYLRDGDGFEYDDVRPRGPRVSPPQRSVRPRPVYDWQDGDDEPTTASGGARPDIRPQVPPVVAFRAGYAPGSIVIDTSARKLYLVRGPMSAYAYPIGVGREGFSWTGKEKISRIADWPDWHPPAEMRKRKPELPEKMTGGVNNPLGARAIYLGNTLYRIHGTNEPKSIGRAESSGCFRMMNHHVVHLASLVQTGAEVTVVRSLGSRAVTASAEPLKPRAAAARTSPRRVERSPDALRPSEPRVRWEDDDDPYPYYAR